MAGVFEEARVGAPAPAPVVPAPERRLGDPSTVRAPETTRRRRLATALLGAPGVALLALVVGVAAAAFAADQDLLLLYADARSHLTIARRLIDGPTSGIVQLGTVWLPLPHASLVPFVGSRWLWHTGYAAIPLGIACLMIESLSVWSILRTLRAARWVAWIGVLLLLTNPSILYLHTTALTEPVLFAAFLGTVAMLAKWAMREKPYSGGEIAVFCGLPAAAAVLSRYDGWAFVAAACLFVVVVARLRWGRWRYAFHITWCFAALPVLAALWWMWFNWVNFADPLEFQRGQYSAEAQQEILAKAGLLPEQHDLLRSLGTFSSSVVRGAGWILVIAGVVGIVTWAWRTRLRPGALAPYLLVAVPFGFYVLSLYTGQIALRLDESGGQSMFNLRYGVTMIPGLAVFAALLVSLAASGAGARRPRRARRGFIVAVAAVAVTAVVVQAGAWWPRWQDVPVVEEGLLQAKAGASQRRGADWLAQHATEGSVLMDDSINPLLPVADVDLDRAIAPFSGPRWTKAMRDPGRARWIFVDGQNPDDAVGKALERHSSVKDDLELRFEDERVRVYESTRSDL